MKRNAGDGLRRARNSGVQSNGNSVIVDRGVLRLASAVSACNGF